MKKITAVASSLAFLFLTTGAALAQDDRPQRNPSMDAFRECVTQKLPSAQIEWENARGEVGGYSVRVLVEGHPIDMHLRYSALPALKNLISGREDEKLHPATSSLTRTIFRPCAENAALVLTFDKK